MSFTKPTWWCEPQPDGEVIVHIGLEDTEHTVSTKGRPSFQTVEDGVYTIVECYRDYFYATSGDTPC